MKLKRLEIENEKWKWKKILENSRETRISLFSVLECCLGANVHSILTFADRRPPEAYDVRAVKVYSWVCTVEEGQKMYSVLIVHVSKVCIVLSQGAVWCSQHMNTYCRGGWGGTLMHPDGCPLGNMMKVEIQKMKWRMTMKDVSHSFSCHGTVLSITSCQIL